VSFAVVEHITNAKGSPGLLPSLLTCTAVLWSQSQGPLLAGVVIFLLDALKIVLQVTCQQNKIFVNMLCLQVAFKHFCHVMKRCK